MKLSPTATSILAILNNINDLITRASDRSSARDVIKALRIYAKNKSFPISDDKIDNLLAVLLDAKPITLTYLIHDLASDVAKIDKKKK